MLARSSILALSAVFGLTACGAFSMSRDTKYGLTQVDDLLGNVESVQVEAVLSKEKAHAALDALRSIVAPNFQGDAVAAYAHLMGTLDQSDMQAKKLTGCVEPLKQTATQVFQEWTQNLESFGNTKMRQHSQVRLEETRTRYEAVLNALVAARISYDAFNSDTRDYALFLEHDFNSAAVAMISADVDKLGDQIRELDGRLDQCIAAAKEYVESGALPGQLEEPQAATPPPARVPEKSTTTPPTRRTKTRPPPASTPSSAPTPSNGQTTTSHVTPPAPAPTPAPTPEPEPSPEPAPEPTPEQP